MWVREQTQTQTNLATMMNFEKKTLHTLPFLLVVVDVRAGLVRLCVVVVELWLLEAVPDAEGHGGDLERLGEQHRGEEGRDHGDHPLVGLVVAEAEPVGQDEEGAAEDADPADDPGQQVEESRPGVAAAVLLAGELPLPASLVHLLAEQALVHRCKERIEIFLFGKMSFPMMNFEGSLMV